MTPMYETVIHRLPSNVPSGKMKAIGFTLDAGIKLGEHQATLNARDDVSEVGRARLMRTYLKTVALPAYLKSVHQLEWHARGISIRKANIDKKAKGETTPLDAEYRSVLRSMEPAERIRAVMDDPQFRGAALRGSASLAGIPAEVFQRAYDSAVAEYAPDESVALAKAEAEQEAHQAALGVVKLDLMRVHAVDDPAIGARAFRDAREFGDFLAKEVAPVPVNVKLRAESEVDELDAA